MFDIIIERILVDVSLDIESQRKCYEIRRKPDITIRRNARAITAELYKIEQINQGIVMYTKRETNDSYVVDYLGDTCTCRYFIKHAYCKHLLHAHEVEIRTAAKSSLTAGLGIKVIPGGLTGKEDVHDMLHLLCNATNMKFDLINEVEMYL